ncbi:hypothetical protein DN310_13515 [Salmonella enterica subsp. salamae]|uniref:Uncharacterized protein n=2 Tax=Salmonella enterica subsp. salamae TaxID=59202 RepID=A0A5Y3MR06_SALER|nr:hypothetical protein [Salmonella enterica subsp. salamae]HAE4966593.1 hypothetical protein [Salmonella enterica subsp. salamae serovar 18:z10:z6]
MRSCCSPRSYYSHRLSRPVVRKASSNTCWPVRFPVLIWIFERVGALAQRLKNSAFLLHLIKTRQELTSDVLKLIFFGSAK